MVIGLTKDRWGLLGSPFTENANFNMMRPTDYISPRRSRVNYRDLCDPNKASPQSPVRTVVSTISEYNKSFYYYIGNWQVATGFFASPLLLC